MGRSELPSTPAHQHPKSITHSLSFANSQQPRHVVSHLHRPGAVLLIHHHNAVLEQGDRRAGALPRRLLRGLRREAQAGCWLVERLELHKVPDTWGAPEAGGVPDMGVFRFAGPPKPPCTPSLLPSKRALACSESSTSGSRSCAMLWLTCRRLM